MKEIIEVLRHFRVKYYSLSITYTFKDPFNTEYVLEVGCDGITFKKFQYFNNFKDDNLIIDYKFELDKNIDPIKTSLYEIFCILSDKGIVIKFI